MKERSQHEARAKSEAKSGLFVAALFLVDGGHNEEGKPDHAD